MTHYDEKLTKGTGVHVRYINPGSATAYHYRSLAPGDSVTISVDPIAPPPPTPAQPPEALREALHHIWRMFMALSIIAGRDAERRFEEATDTTLGAVAEQARIALAAGEREEGAPDA